MKALIKRNVITRALSILPSTSRKKFVAVCLLQIALGFLDLIGVAGVGLMSALAVTGLQSEKPGLRVDSILKFLNLTNLPFHTQIQLIALGVTLLFIVKTILSIFFSRKALFFLSRRGCYISTTTLAKLLSQPLLYVQKRSVQENLFAVTRGIQFIAVNILGVFVLLVSDLSLLLIMGVGLFALDVVTAISTLLFFTGIALFLHWFTSKRATELGRLTTRLTLTVNEKVTEVLATYRESVVRNRREYYARKIGEVNNDLADNYAETNFLPYVSKYVIESGFVIGSVALGAVAFYTMTTSHAIATISVFLAAGTRIAPALLRLQQGVTQIRGAAAQAETSFQLIEEMLHTLDAERVSDEVDLIHSGFNPEVSIKLCSFSYPQSSKFAIDQVSLNIPAGGFTAFVGPSGAGKTTMIDLLLGVIRPDSGKVLISGVDPSVVVSSWPGAMAYVPQDVVIINGSIRENIALGYPLDEATDERIMDAIRFGRLENLIEDLPNGLDESVGEGGSRLSGGQRQRLGIARAMFTNPKLIVLDEATSALDSQIENELTEAIFGLKGKVTIVMVAHRLSTVREVDQVVYFDGGRILASGKFEEVRKEISAFNQQATLMGL